MSRIFPVTLALEFHIASDTDYTPLDKAVRRINEEYDVHMVSDIIGKMADLALQACPVGR